MFRMNLRFQDKEIEAKVNYMELEWTYHVLHVEISGVDFFRCYDELRQLIAHSVV